MIILSTDEVLEIHEKVIAATGGPLGVRSIDLLESAVFGCYQTFNGNDLYPTIVEKAARMAFTLCNNHPFIDGNKRTAVTSMLVFLQMNDIFLLYTQQELIDIGLGLANGNISYEDTVDWIKMHI